MFMVQTSAGCPGMSGATYLASKRQVSGACSNDRARANAEDEPMDDPLPPFKSVAYAGRASGPRLLVAGAVALAAGSVTFVPIANPLAYARKRRAGDRNLNRALQPTDAPREFEDHVANWLCPLLAAHDVLLDLHSFQSPGQPFVMVGPRDNRGTLEPFAHAAEEEALALRLGVARAVDGWLDTYAIGVARKLDTDRKST